MISLDCSEGSPATRCKGRLEHISFESPQKPQYYGYGAYLRQLPGDPKRFRGFDYWYVPLQKEPKDYEGSPAEVGKNKEDDGLNH